MKLPKNIRKNKDDEYILTDSSGKKWNLDSINGIIGDIREREEEIKQREYARQEERFDRSKISARARLKVRRQVIK